MRSHFPDWASYWAVFSEEKVVKDKHKVPVTTQVKMAWTKIKDKSREIRDKLNEEDADAARKEYGERLHDELNYRHGGKLEVYKTDESLARAYRKRKGTFRPWDDEWVRP